MNTDRTDRPNEPRQRLLPIPPSLLLLGLLAALPWAFGRSLRQPSESALQPRLPLWQKATFHDAEISLPGRDGSSVRLAADTLRLEAASAGVLVSTTKAVVARNAALRPMDADLPEWRFRRVEIQTELGPHDWFGPARYTTRDGTVEVTDSPRGVFSIVAGEVERHPRQR